MPLQLREYQKQTILKAVEHNGRLLIANDMGTGKTLCAIASARAVRTKRMLVVCPISVAQVWRREVANFWPDARVVDATSGTIAARAKQVKQISGDRETVLLVGYETYWREPLREAILNWAPDTVILDEAHRIKSRSAKQSRFAHLLANRAPHRLALSATPMTNGPEDLYSVFRFVDPTVFGTRWADFEWKYVVKGGYLGKQIIGYRNRDELEARLHEWSTRITKAEALDLPEEVPVEIEVILSPRSRDTYEQMRLNAVAEVTDLKGEESLALSRIVVTNILRLKQVTSGFIKTVGDQEVDIGTEKLDVLTELLEDQLPAVGSVVVFAHFRRDVRRIAERCKARGWDAYQLSGEVPNTERESNLEQWRQTGGVLVCQVAVSSLGIDLSNAHIAVYYSVDYSLTNWIQCHGRLHRHGQTNKVTNYYLIARDTIDEEVYKALSRKEDLTRTILDRSSARKLFAP